MVLFLTALPHNIQTWFIRRHDSTMLIFEKNKLFLVEKEFDKVVQVDMCTHQIADVQLLLKLVKASLL